MTYIDVEKTREGGDALAYFVSQMFRREELEAALDRARLGVFENGEPSPLLDRQEFDNRASIIEYALQLQDNGTGATS